jgi:hypothetical protein
MRAQKYLVMPDEDAAEFADLQTALVAELAPVGALQVVLARRVAIAAWRLARADRLAAGTGLGPRSQPGGQQAELFEERRYTDGGVGLALIRGGNGTRSFETLLRYRGAAMAEFWRALRTLKALQADARAHAAAEVEAPVRPRAGAPGFAAGPLDRSAAVRKRAKRTQESRDSGQTGPATRASELGRRAVLERPRPRPPAAPAAGPARHSRAARVADRTRDPTPRRLRAGHAARAWRSRASARAPRA